ncbi:hypothetical protein JCM11641_008106 [Rhodosporidiobolus odoratus]
MASGELRIFGFSLPSLTAAFSLPLSSAKSSRYSILGRFALSDPITTRARLLDFFGLHLFDFRLHTPRPIVAPMLRSTVKFSRPIGCQQAKQARRIHSSQPPHHTHTVSSPPSSAHKASESKRRTRNLAVAAGAAVLAGTAYSTSRVSEDDFLLPPSVNANDPLSALDPALLARTTAHLTGATLSDLFRQWVVYAVSGQPLLVESAPWIVGKLQWAKDNVPVLGSAVWAIFAVGINNTFYRVYAGGESVPGCAPVVQAYASKGVGVMLNYSAEAPLGTAKSGDGIDHASMKEIHTAVIESAKLTPSSASQPIKPALLAIKLSGLIYDASILRRASTALNGSTTVARGGRLPSSIPFPQSPELSSEDHQQLDKLYDGLRKVAREAKQQGVRLLVDAEQSWFQPAIDRYCDLLSEEFNRVAGAYTSSTPAAPIVYNTYQCYRRDTPAKIAAQLAHADANNYGFGAKLVRGAYQESERKTHSDTPAVNAGEPCVVWDTKAETDACYDECAALLEKRLVEDLKQTNQGQAGVGVCLASHNGLSMQRFLGALREDGLAVEKDGGLEVDERLRGRVAFGQLMGMSDNLTTTLVNVIRPSPSASSDRSIPPLVVKYLPYASLEQGLPYLTRRASENSSILKGDPTSGRGGAADERRAVGKEVRRRLGLWF